MPRIFLPIIALAALVAACGSAAGSADKNAEAAASAGRGAHASPAASGGTATAGGAVAPVATPHDTISDLADRGRILGDTSATLWVIMASDFQCPFCRQWHDRAFQKVLNGYVKTGKVRMAFLNMPLSMHANAVPASEAAMCASVQNKFWPMHEALFASQAEWETLPNPDSAMAVIAKKQGLDMAAWKNCYDNHLTRSLIQADHDRAIRSHVNSTPTFFVGDQVLAGADADVPAAIDAALKARGTKKPATN